MNLQNKVCNETPYQNGSKCFSVGMSIHANPFRNTDKDCPLDSFNQWKDGWNSAKSAESNAK